MHGIPTHLDPMSIVNKAVEDAVSQCGITDLLVPARGRPPRSTHPPPVRLIAGEEVASLVFIGMFVNIRSGGNGSYPCGNFTANGLHGGQFWSCAARTNWMRYLSGGQFAHVVVFLFLATHEVLGSAVGDTESLTAALGVELQH
jgi:hypothetical protein